MFYNDIFFLFYNGWTVKMQTMSEVNIRIFKRNLCRIIKGFLLLFDGKCLATFADRRFTVFTIFLLYTHIYTTA